MLATFWTEVRGVKFYSLSEYGTTRGVLVDFAGKNRHKRHDHARWPQKYRLETCWRLHSTKCRFQRCEIWQMGLTICLKAVYKPFKANLLLKHPLVL